MLSSKKLSPILENYLKQSVAMPRFEECSIPELRTKFKERQKQFNANLPSYNLEIHDEVAVTSHGPIPIRIYKPCEREQLPAVALFHGGGFVFGDLDTSEHYCREIAHFAKCIVISVDYPLAPEHPFPAAPTACYVAASWIQTNLHKWRGDPQQFFVGGSSAGASLAAAVCFVAREHKEPAISGQILLCPMTDTDFFTTSYTV